MVQKLSLGHKLQVRLFAFMFIQARSGKMDVKTFLTFSLEADDTTRMEASGPELMLAHNRRTVLLVKVLCIDEFQLMLVPHKIEGHKLRCPLLYVEPLSSLWAVIKSTCDFFFFF